MSSPTKSTFLTKLTVPTRSGKVDLKNFFPRLTPKQVVVDKELVDFVSTTKHYELQKPLACNVDKSPLGGIFSVLLNINDKTELNIHQVCAILVYFGTEGWPLLEISSQKDEINVLVGYVFVNGKYFALIVEHEYNNNVEEINLNMREPEHEEDDPTLVLKIT